MAICWLGTLLLPVYVAPPLLLSINFYLFVLASTFSVPVFGLTLVPVTLWLPCLGLLPSLPPLISLWLFPSYTPLVFSMTSDLGPFCYLFRPSSTPFFPSFCVCLFLSCMFFFGRLCTTSLLLTF